MILTFNEFLYRWYINTRKGIQFFDWFIEHLQSFFLFFQKFINMHIGLLVILFIFFLTKGAANASSLQFGVFNKVLKTFSTNCVIVGAHHERFLLVCIVRILANRAIKFHLILLFSVLSTSSLLFYHTNAHRSSTDTILLLR